MAQCPKIVFVKVSSSSFLSFPFFVGGGVTVVMVIEKEIGFAVVTIFPVLLCHMWCCQYMHVCVCILLAFLDFFPR